MPDPVHPLPPPPPRVAAKQTAWSDLAQNVDIPYWAWLPEAWGNARKTPIMGTNKVGDFIGKDSVGEYHHYGYPNHLSPNQTTLDDIRNPRPYIVLSPNEGTQPGDTLTIAHEYGHAGYRQDVAEPDQMEWDKIHNRYLDLAKTRKLDLSQIPFPILYYSDNTSESFATAFSDYVTGRLNPAVFPDIYNYFRRLTGRDYSKLVGSPSEPSLVRPTPMNLIEMLTSSLRRDR